MTKSKDVNQKLINQLEKQYKEMEVKYQSHKSQDKTSKLSYDKIKKDNETLTR